MQCIGVYWSGCASALFPDSLSFHLWLDPWPELHHQHGVITEWYGSLHFLFQQQQWIQQHGGGGGFFFFFLTMRLFFWSLAEWMAVWERHNMSILHKNAINKAYYTGSWCNEAHQCCVALPSREKLIKCLFRHFSLSDIVYFFFLFLRPHHSNPLWKLLPPVSHSLTSDRTIEPILHHCTCCHNSSLFYEEAIGSNGV